MATSQSFVDYVIDQLQSVPTIRAQKMFGEYALYCNSKVVALICDDQLFIKVTAPGTTFVAGHYQEAPPYPGAKPSMLIENDRIEDHEWLCSLIRITEDALPTPKVKKSKAKKKSS